MKVGLLTAPFRNDDIKTVVEFAAEAGFDCLEIRAEEGIAHFDPDSAQDLPVITRNAGLEISSLAAYVNVTATDPDERAHHQAWLTGLVEICQKAGVDVLCCIAGLPPEGMTREETIEQIAAPFFTELCAKAADAGVKIALENWFATNIMHLGQWDLLFGLVPDANFGLNFDPSHLVWQDIDYLAAVEKFADRIFHTHAKDIEIRYNQRAHTGNQNHECWRYVIPGFGEIDWGSYIGRLRHHGYDGVLSIEHEDSAWGREEGFIKGLQHLRPFV